MNCMESLRPLRESSVRESRSERISCSTTMVALAGASGAMKASSSRTDVMVSSLKRHG